MYTLEELKQKSFRQLKDIGLQLNVLPEGDKRCRQNWIDAIVGINLPLLQLLEASPAASVEQVQEPIREMVETSPGVEVDRVQEVIESFPEALECPICGGVHALFTTKDCLERAVICCVYCNYSRIKNYPGAIKVQAQELIEFNRNNFSGVEYVTESNRNNFSGVGVDPAQKAIEVQAQEAFELLVENSPSVEVEQVQEPHAPFSAKKLPGSRSKASTAHQLLELFQSRVHIIEDSPGVKTETAVSESARGPAAKNPLLIGVTLSDRFCARYSPPQSEIIHFQSDADGQLSLLNFEIESLSEPPDPDDFESLDAFREALARWDFEHNEVSSEHNEVSPEHNEPLQVSLDSFCLWVPCSADWYESAALLEPSKVVELSLTRKSSITSDFFIPIFGCLSVRPNRSDEPPDTWIYARLPKPKAPSFSPMAVGQARAKLRPNASQTYPKRGSSAGQAQSKRILNVFQTHTKRIPNSPNLLCQSERSSFLKLAYCRAIPVGRAPPGGDAWF
jgi:hypothetical protein